VGRHSLIQILFRLNYLRRCIPQRELQCKKYGVTFVRFGTIDCQGVVLGNYFESHFASLSKVSNTIQIFVYDLSGVLEEVVTKDYNFHLKPIL